MTVRNGVWGRLWRAFLVTALALIPASARLGKRADSAQFRRVIGKMIQLEKEPMAWAEVKAPTS